MTEIENNIDLAKLDFKHLNQFQKTIPLQIINDNDNFSNLLLFPADNQTTLKLLHNQDFVSQIAQCRDRDTLKDSIAPQFNLKVKWLTSDEETAFCNFYSILVNLNYFKNYKKPVKPYSINLAYNSYFYDCKVIDTMYFPLGATIQHLKDHQIMFLNVRVYSSCQLTINSQQTVNLQPTNVMNDTSYYILNMDDNKQKQNISCYINQANKYSSIVCITSHDDELLDCYAKQTQVLKYDNQQISLQELHSDDKANEFVRWNYIAKLNTYNKSYYRELNENFYYEDNELNTFLTKLNQPTVTIKNELIKHNSELCFKVKNYKVKDYWLIKPSIKDDLNLKRLQCLQGNFLFGMFKLSTLISQSLLSKLIARLKQNFNLEMENENECSSQYLIKLPAIKIVHPQQYVFNEYGKWSDNVSDFDTVLDITTLLKENTDMQKFVAELQKYNQILADTINNFTYDEKLVHQISQQIPQVDQLFYATLFTNGNPVQANNQQAFAQALANLITLLNKIDPAYANYINEFYHQLLSKALQCYQDEQLSQKSLAELEDSVGFIRRNQVMTSSKYHNCY